MKDESNGAARAARRSFAFLLSICLHPSSFTLHPWTPMLTPSAPKFRRHPAPPKKTAAPPPPPPVALTLVAAAYDESSLILTLTFDRPVNIDAFDGSAVQVGDPTFNHAVYDGTGNAAYLVSPTTVGIYLAQQGDYFGTEVDLMADAFTGIVAVNDGGTWAGTGGGVVFLPYP